MSNPVFDFAICRDTLEELVIQIERSNAVDDHGHPLTMLKALHDAQKLLGRPVTNQQGAMTFLRVDPDTF